MGGIQSSLRTTLLLVVGLQAGSAAAQQCAAVGQLYSIDGEVSVQRQGAWQKDQQVQKREDHLKDFEPVAGLSHHKRGENVHCRRTWL